MLLILSFLASLVTGGIKLLVARPALTLAALLGFAVGSYATLYQAPPPAPTASRAASKAPVSAARLAKTSVPAIF